MPIAVDRTAQFVCYVACKRIKKSHEKIRWKESKIIVKVGLDFSGVIVVEESDGDQVTRSDDAVFGKNYVRSKEAQWAADAVRSIIYMFGASNMFIISNAHESSYFCWITLKTIVSKVVRCRPKAQMIRQFGCTHLLFLFSNHGGFSKFWHQLSSDWYHN